MADQAAPGTMAEASNTGAHGLDAQIGPSYVHEAHHGRPASWVAVSIIIVGFIVGGIALPVGPIWWLFWLGAGIVVLGGHLRCRRAHLRRLVLDRTFAGPPGARGRRAEMSGGPVRVGRCAWMLPRLK